MSEVRVRRHTRRRRAPISPQEIIARGTIVKRLREPESGIREKRLVELKASRGPLTKALIKETGSWVLTESIADTIDDLLGWDIVPPTTARVERDLGLRGITLLGRAGDPVSVQRWVPNARSLADEDEDAVRVVERNFDRAMKIAVFDFIIGNGDRHEGNIIVDGRGQLWAIDHDTGYTFGAPIRRTEGRFSLNNDFLFAQMEGKRIPDDILIDLRNLSEGDLRAAVAPMAATGGIR